MKNSNRKLTVYRNPIAPGFWVHLIFLGSVFFGVIFFLALPRVHAADVTVTNGQTVGQQTLGDGDTLTVNQGGTVSVNGAGQSAVTDTVGGTITVNNSGTISSTGTGASQGVSGGGAVLNTTNSGTTTATDGGVTAITLQNLTNSGTITGGVEGVRATTIQNLTNSGTITGTSGNGLQAATMVNITNSGTITAGNDGVQATTLQSLTNNGTITGAADGVQATTLQSLTNNGTITGNGGAGVFTVTIQGLTNNGTITGSNQGVRALTIQSLTNNGTITGGTGAGIETDFGTVINSGLVQGVKGIDMDRDTAGNASVTNSGTIRSTSGPAGIAIDFQGTGNDSLILSGKSKIVGAINLGAGTDTLTFRSGRSSTLTFDSAPEVINTNKTGPVFRNGSQIAMLDATSLSLADDNMAILTNRLGSILSQQANRSVALEQFARLAAQQARKVLLASAGGPVSLPSPDQKKYRAWVKGFGGFNDRNKDGSTLGADTYFAGGIVGIDTLTARNNRLGLFFGGSHTNVDVEFNSEKDNINSYFGGLYAGRHFGPNALNGSLTLGGLNFDSNRSVANNTVVGGLESAKADYSGFFINPQVTLARTLPMSSGLTIIPSLRLGYTGLFIESYKEKGSTANLSVGSRDLHLLQTRAQVGLNFSEWINPPRKNQNGPWDLELILGLNGRINMGSDKVNATLIGQSLSFDPGGDDKVLKGFGGLNMAYAITNDISLSGSVEGGAGTNNSTYTTGWIKGVFRF